MSGGGIHEEDTCLLAAVAGVGCGKGERIQNQTSADQAAKLAADQNVPKVDDGGIDDVKTFRYPKEQASAKKESEGQLTTGSNTEESDGLPQGQPKRWTLIMDTEQHYRATDFRLPLDRVITAFKKYLNDDDSWKADFKWKRLIIE